ncbi:MAG: hypothetical protein JF614_18235 [Acidobacteria bacterium]|nr:hypothetical protein [Acidobacteriota bacterium]
MSAGRKELGSAGQSLWGGLGGLTPYAVAALRAVGNQTSFPLPSFSLGFCLVLVLSAALGVLGSILLESHTRFAAWFHGGSFPIMLNFLFGESLHQASHPPPH